MSKEDPELAACPFCGEADAHLSVSGWRTITCPSCGCDGPSGNTAEEATRLWNSRMSTLPDGPFYVEKWYPFLKGKVDGNWRYKVLASKPGGGTFIVFSSYRERAEYFCDRLNAAVRLWLQGRENESS